jgi:hypothetical protein
MIFVSSNPDLERRGHTALDMQVKTQDGEVFCKSVDIARGFPGNPLTKEEHLQRFRDCIAYKPEALPPHKISRLISLVDRIETLTDVRVLIPLLLKEAENG